jgi:hypothetical protein
MTVCVAAAALTGCGGDADARWSEKPVGEPVLPDFMPVPPADIHTKLAGDSWTVEFSSTLVNVGKGDFHATAERLANGPWTVMQDVEYDGGGADHVVIPAEPVWAGDGHEHWHLKRVVEYHLVPHDPDGRPEPGPGLTDHKIGFCIYDFEKQHLGYGPDDQVYDRQGCGRSDSALLVMGLSPGWGDVYNWDLPGQSIDISDLGDGPYRITAVADEAGIFHEVSTENNTTWVDFDLSTDAEGNRLAQVTEVGPEPE